MEWISWAGRIECLAHALYEPENQPNPACVFLQGKQEDVCDSALVSVCLRERKRVRKLLPLCARKEREKLLLNCRIWAKLYLIANVLKIPIRQVQKQWHAESSHSSRNYININDSVPPILLCVQLWNVFYWTDFKCKSFK